MEIYYQYVRLRKQFGRWPRLVDEGAEMIADIRPNEEHAKDYIPRNPVIAVTQCVPDMSEHDANTTAVILATKAMSHMEGGWPKDVDYTEAEHTIRYRKKVEKDEDYIKACVNLGTSIEDLVKQNNAIDIYQQYFSDVQSDHTAETPSAHTVTVFKDPSEIKRSAAYVNWHPDATVPKVAIAYARLKFQEQPTGMPISSYIWDINNPNTPDYEMQPTSQLCSIKFNLKDPNLLGAGQYNGAFSLFDSRKGSGHIDCTPIDISHRDPIYDFAWTQSKTGTECMTVSTDGQVIWWDIRKMSEQLENMPLKDRGSDVILGGVSLEYDVTAGAQKFMVGTEQGIVLNCNRKAKNPADRVAGSYSGHYGPVYGLKRNPFFPKYFLSLADWSARIWSEDLKTPLITTRYHSTYITAGGWSPSRAGVFFTTKLDGSLDVWDVYYKHNEPTLTVQVMDTTVCAFGTQSTGKVMALGGDDGTCTVLQLSNALHEPQYNEAKAMSNMFERETLREKNLDKALKEARVKARREAARKDDVVDNFTPELQQQLEDDFFKSTATETKAEESAPAS